ncbi:MAG: PHP domain-containing protein, partial [Acidobacteriota bacterium]
MPLVNRTAFTFYSGAMLPETLAKACAGLGYAAAGICDRDGLYAAVRFYKAAKAAGIRPVLGAEITGAAFGTSDVGIRKQKNAAKADGSAPFIPQFPIPSPKSPLFAFARDLEGYSRLCRLITRRNLEPERFDRVGECATATEGGHVTLAASDVTLLYALKKAGGEPASLFARLSGNPKADADARAAANWLNLPCLAAPAAFFPGPSGYAIHRVLRAVKHLPPEAGPADYPLSPAEAERRFAGGGARATALEAAGELAASCD